MATTDTRHERSIGRALAVVYGGIAYALFLVAALYAVGFLANVAAPTTIDGPATTSTTTAAVVNLLLLGLFAVQHSVMARPWFKEHWTRVVPAPLERSTYVLLASVVLLLLLALWQPLPAVLWDVGATPARMALWTLYALGWALVIWSTFLIDHWDFLGLKQVWSLARRREHRSPGFVTPLAYKLVRHPLMTGFLIAFWATPTLTAGHALFAAVATGYILVAVRLEEHDLLAAAPEYAAYAARTPRFIPRPGRRTH